MRRILLASIFAPLLLAPASLAQTPGNPERGRTEAIQLCSDCHQVEKHGAPSPVKTAPSFTALAKTRGMSAMALNVWLQTSHPTMPNIRLTADTRDDIIAWILSLKASDSQSDAQPQQPCSGCAPAPQPTALDHS